MPVTAPRQLQILEGLEAALKSALGDIEFARNDFTAADPAEVARVNMFDGDPGPPVEELLGGPKTYRHEIPLEIVPSRIGGVAEIHAIHGRVKAMVKADRFLTGLVDFLDLSEVASVPVPISEAQALETGLASLIAEYTL
ncbi:hypothetical protein CA606_18205 [Caulobacter vibrioides]|uniref:Uncharacterized protein n=1 Tax=Caulobacter vibrioides TaxID=155892 RepID=A0A290MPX1_CAUVI|nr:hypothetical protein [Caulobacter vibrioides]ATC34107.1 hypothetical protein CA606_18205 [Caulobacter vibrioides]